MQNKTTETELEVLLENIDLKGPVPEEEPMRQYYFIKKARHLLEEKNARAESLHIM